MNTYNFKSLIILLIISILTLGCNQSVPDLLNTYNKSTYTLSSVTEDPPSDRVKVNFTFNFSDPKTLANPVQVKAGCALFRTTENDLEFMIDKSDMPIQFKVTSIGYFSIETAPINTNQVEEISVEVNFAEDDRPLLHCEESVSIQKDDRCGF